MTLEQLYAKIENYLKSNFKQELTLDNSISYEDAEADIWGFNKVIILIKEVDGRIHYKPFFQTNSKK